VVAPSPAPSAPRLLVLWDVDHTLLETRGVGRAVYDRAFPAATGKPLVELAAVSGRTERDIIAETLRINGVEPTDNMMARLADALVHGYDIAREELRAVGRALPGARDTLAGLASEPAVHQSVLTGNLREVARIKLEAFGLDSYLDLGAGAYGDDARDRAALVEVAMHRARGRTGSEFTNDNTILVGDTANDVEAGRSRDVRVIGVATGETSASALRAAGAHDVATSLAECSIILTRQARQLAR
jgi:phosphoglycolate phosphatase